MWFIILLQNSKPLYGYIRSSHQFQGINICLHSDTIMLHNCWKFDNFSSCLNLATSKYSQLEFTLTSLYIEVLCPASQRWLWWHKLIVRFDHDASQDILCCQTLHTSAGVEQLLSLWPDYVHGHDGAWGLWLTTLSNANGVPYHVKYMLRSRNLHVEVLSIWMSSFSSSFSTPISNWFTFFLHLFINWYYILECSTRNLGYSIIMFNNFCFGSPKIICKTDYRFCPVWSLLFCFSCMSCRS